MYDGRAPDSPFRLATSTLLRQPLQPQPVAVFPKAQALPQVPRILPQDSAVTEHAQEQACQQPVAHRIPQTVGQKGDSRGVIQSVTEIDGYKNHAARQHTQTACAPQQYPQTVALAQGQPQRPRQEHDRHTL